MWLLLPSLASLLLAFTSTLRAQGAARLEATLWFALAGSGFSSLGSRRDCGSTSVGTDEEVATRSQPWVGKQNGPDFAEFC